MQRNSELENIFKEIVGFLSKGKEKIQEATISSLLISK